MFVLSFIQIFSWITSFFSFLNQYCNKPTLVCLKIIYCTFMFTLNFVIVMCVGESEIDVEFKEDGNLTLSS